MRHDGSSWLTTGQAAKLCSVTPDTILKWIRKGRLQGVRTAGGHYRISRSDLEHLATPTHENVESNNSGHNPLRCWEYLSEGGVVKENCKSCVVYRTRATRCFELAQLGIDNGHGRQFCRTSCDDCVYFRRVKGLATNVLVISPDRTLTDALSAEEDGTLSFRIARNGYEASAIVSEFRPAFVLVDREAVTGGGDDVLRCLAHDPRLPGLKVVLAIPSGTAAREKASLVGDHVVSVIEKPFGVSQIASVVNSFPVELLVPEDHDS